VRKRCFALSKKKKLMGIIGQVHPKVTGYVVLKGEKHLNANKKTPL
jgi:phenylalanyl-tRNA synthetase beta subunit